MFTVKTYAQGGRESTCGAQTTCACSRSAPRPACAAAGCSPAASGPGLAPAAGSSPETQRGGSGGSGGGETHRADVTLQLYLTLQLHDARMECCTVVWQLLTGSLQSPNVHAAAAKTLQLRLDHLDMGEEETSSIESGQTNEMQVKTGAVGGRGVSDLLL